MFLDVLTSAVHVLKKKRKKSGTLLSRLTLLMVLDGTFHNTFERGLLGNVSQNNINKKPQVEYNSTYSSEIYIMWNVTE